MSTMTRKPNSAGLRKPNIIMNINELPPELLLKIFSYIPQRHLILKLNRVCLFWNELCLSPNLWTVLEFSKVYENISEPLDHLYNIQHYIKTFKIEGPFICEIFQYCRQINFHNVQSLQVLDGMRQGIDEIFIDDVLNKFPNLASISVSLSARVNIALCLNAFSKMNLESLDIEYRQLVCFDEHLLNFTNGNPYLKELSLRGSYKLKDDTIIAILNGCTNLSTFRLLGSGISSGVFTTSTEPLTLTNFSINSDVFDDNGLDSLSRRASGLKSLDIKQCNKITERGLRCVALNCPLIEELHLGETQTQLSTTAVGVLEGCGNFTCFSASNFDLDDHSLFVLFKSCNLLTYIELRCTRSIADQILQYLGKYCPLLKTVNLTKCWNVSFCSIISVIKMCKRLVDLSVISRKVYDYNQTTSNQTMDPNVSVTTEENTSGHSHLRSLIVIWNKGITREHIQRVTNLCPDLRMLNLSYFTVNRMDDPILRQVFCKCKFLKTIMMDFKFFHRPNDDTI